MRLKHPPSSQTKFSLQSTAPGAVARNTGPLTVAGHTDPRAVPRYTSPRAVRCRVCDGSWLDGISPLLFLLLLLLRRHLVPSDHRVTDPAVGRDQSHQTRIRLGSRVNHRPTRVLDNFHLLLANISKRWLLPASSRDCECLTVGLIGSRRKRAELAVRPLVTRAVRRARRPHPSVRLRDQVATHGEAIVPHPQLERGQP